MFDLKKFIALIGIEDSLMQMFYDKAEAVGLNPRFDIYHILEGKEKPSTDEIEIMKKMYQDDIKGTDYEKSYQTADTDFWEKLSERNKKRSAK